MFVWRRYLSSLARLKAANTRDDLAKILNVKPKDLSYILYVMPPRTKYTSFDIPKASGGTRTVHAPNSHLKSLQDRTSKLLYDCFDEVLPINFNSGARALSHGFQRKRNLSIISNGAKHRNRRFLFNLDLEDFFGSFNFGRIRGYFISNNDFRLKSPVATALAQIVCHENKLPQGAPSSPIVTELITRILDVRLLKIAKEFGCTYSRYADDISFSTNKHSFPDSIAVPRDDGIWSVGPAVLNKITQSGFRINDSKTRMQLKSSRQVATGLVVNEKVNVPAEYSKQVRSMTFALFQTGKCFAQDVRTKAANPVSIAALGGKIEHMFHVKSKEYLDDQGKPHPVSRFEGDKIKIPAFYRSYGDFIFFRSFCFNDKPIILCEGVTDNIYLKAAMKSKAASFKSFAVAHITSKKTSLLVDFYSYSKSAQLVMKLTGGAAPLKSFIADYGLNFSRFKAAKLANPVIVVVDNDAANNPLWALLRDKYKVVGADGSAQFYRVTKNLYVVPIPRIGGKDTFIEHLFDQATLDAKLDGKTFDFGQKNKIIAAGKYGKKAFAKNVVAVNRKTINFDGFDALLTNIQAAIQAHATAPV